MQLGTVQVRSLLGDEISITDEKIRETLWYYYFDINQTVDWLLQEQIKAKKQSIATTTTTKSKNTSDKRQDNSRKETKQALAGQQQQQKTFKFDSPSPDDVVLKAQSQRTGQKTSKSKESAQSNDTTQFEMDMASLNINVANESGNTSTSIKHTPKKGKLDVLKELEKRERPNINLIVIGHVDAGKSTLLGHLLYLQGNINEHTYKKNEREAQNIGKGSFAHAWVLDATEEERSRGITMDVATTSLETKHRKFTLLDAPGHRDFVPRMISGAAQADAAILVIDASKGGFEAGFGQRGQTREHVVLARSLGIQQLIVAINKMDTVDWSATRFNEIKEQLNAYLIQTGFKSNSISFIPCSGMNGVNLLDQGRKEPGLEWYAGVTVAEAMDKFESPERAVDKPFRLPIVDVFKGSVQGAGGISVSGRIESGHVQVGDEVMVRPGEELCVVKAMEVGDELPDWAAAGDTVTLTVTGTEMIHFGTGTILCSPLTPVPVVSHFKARIVVFEPSIPITIGYPTVLFHHNLNIAATIVKLEAVIDKTTGEVTKKNPRHLSKSSAALVDIRTERPICLELFSTSKELGRITLRKDADTIAAGIVVEIFS
ncbi:P-loop containing nucleoside triphosphate hydrolase protein [Syncephalis fuscata]|nr:P-loop containing nucleoside triphosphate hydrolase protein [Syncephalis fuscata]